MKFFWDILLFVILVACSPSSVVITPSVIAIPTKTQTILSATNTTPPKSVPPTDSISTPTPITAQVEIIAPNVREVELSELELSNTTRLILYYEPSNSLRIISGQDIQPKKSTLSIQMHGSMVGLRLALIKNGLFTKCLEA